MKMRYLGLLLVCFSILAFAETADTENSFTLGFIPNEVSIGMTRVALEVNRPTAQMILAGSRNTNVVVLSEMQLEKLPHTFYQYHFIDGQLRAVAKAVSHAMGRDASIINGIRQSIANNFKKVEDQTILRIDEKMEVIHPVVELWKNKKRGVCAYFSDCAMETQIIVFDPAYLGKKDFFLGVDEEDVVRPAVKKMKKRMESLRKSKEKKKVAP